MLLAAPCSEPECGISVGVALTATLKRDSQVLLMLIFVGVAFVMTFLLMKVKRKVA